ncbi:MAG TPA: response regulator [Drouetiella sp.]
MTIEHVLLVDDDPNIRKIAEISLSKVGKWRVSLASSGREALDMAVNERPDVILLDVMMPELDGPSTLKCLRHNCAVANIPVIFVTAKVQNHEMAKYAQMGAMGVIVKPFDPMLLPKQVMDIIDQKVLLTA